MHNNFNESKYFLRKRTLGDISPFLNQSPHRQHFAYVLQAVIFAEIVYKMINLHNLYKITRKSHSPEETMHAIQCLQFVSIWGKKKEEEKFCTRAVAISCVCRSSLEHARKVLLLGKNGSEMSASRISLMRPKHMDQSALCAASGR